MKVTIKLKQGRCMTIKLYPLLQLGVVAYKTKCKQDKLILW